MTTEAQITRKIQNVKKKIAALGEVFPGSISQQFNICGTPGCKCKDKENPIKHGPYSNLSYTFKRKSSTKFIRKELLKDFKRYTENYKKLRDYVDLLVELNMELINLRSKKR